MKRIVALVTASVLMSSCVSNTKYKQIVIDFENKIEEMEMQIQELEEEKNDLEYENRKLEYRVVALEDQVENMENVISRAKSMCMIWSDDAYMAWSVLNEY